MAVYGNLLSAFPELMRTFEIFSKPDKSDLHKIRAVFMPTRGDRLKQQKFTNRGKAIDYFEDDCLFVPFTYASKVSIGDYFYEPHEGHLGRLVGRADWTFEGGFVRYITERVTGVTFEDTQDLEVKEARFD